MVVKILSTAAIAAAATTAQGAFQLGSTDFGGFDNTNGSPLGVAGGTILAQLNTDPGGHTTFNSILGGATGWGTTIGGLQDSAPAAQPYDAATGSFTADALQAIVPAGGTGAATTTSFGGFYAGNASVGGAITTTDDDAWVARIAVSENATLTTTGAVYIAVQGLGDANESILGIDETGVIDDTNDNRTDGANYRLEFRQRSTVSADGGLGDVYDVFVVVPTPGTAALFGVAGLATIRRRRA